MKKRHTTRHQRQAVRQSVERRIQELEQQQQLPRRAALALLQMREAAENKCPQYGRRRGKEARS